MFITAQGTADQGHSARHGSNHAPAPRQTSSSGTLKASCTSSAAWPALTTTLTPPAACSSSSSRRAVKWRAMRGGTQRLSRRCASTVPVRTVHARWRPGPCKVGTSCCPHLLGGGHLRLLGGRLPQAPGLQRRLDVRVGPHTRVQPVLYRPGCRAGWESVQIGVIHADIFN